MDILGRLEGIFDGLPGWKADARRETRGENALEGVLRAWELARVTARHRPRNVHRGHPGKSQAGRIDGFHCQAERVAGVKVLRRQGHGRQYLAELLWRYFFREKASQNTDKRVSSNLLHAQKTQNGRFANRAKANNGGTMRDRKRSKAKKAITVAVFIILMAIICYEAAALVFDQPLVFYDSVTREQVGCEIAGIKHRLIRCGDALVLPHELAWIAPGWKPTEQGKE